MYLYRRRFTLATLCLVVLFHCCNGSRESDSSNEDDALKQALLLVELLKAEYVKAVQENGQLREQLAAANVSSLAKAVPANALSHTPENNLKSQQPEVLNTNLQTFTSSVQTSIPQEEGLWSGLQENNQVSQQVSEDNTNTQSTTTTVPQQLSTDVESLAEYIKILQEKNLLDEQFGITNFQSSTNTPQPSTSDATSWSGQLGESSTSSTSSQGHSRSTSQTTEPTQSDVQVPFYGNYRRNLPADVAWSKEMLTDFRRKFVEKANVTTPRESDKSLMKSSQPKHSKNSLTESNDKPKKKKSDSVIEQVRLALKKTKKKNEKSSSKRATGRITKTSPKSTYKHSIKMNNKERDKKEEIDPIMDQVRQEIRRELGTPDSAEQVVKLKAVKKPSTDLSSSHTNATSSHTNATSSHTNSSSSHAKDSSKNKTVVTRITPRSTYKIFLGKSTKIQIPLPENNAFCYYYPKSPLCGTYIGK